MRTITTPRIKSMDEMRDEAATGEGAAVTRDCGALIIVKMELSGLA
jgi:hypothetical protein